MVSIAEMVSRQVRIEETARRERMRRAWNAYQGEAAGPLKVKPGDADDNVRVNYARLIVDKGVSFLFGGGVEMRTCAEAGSDAQAWLDGFWEANGKAALLHRLAVNGAVCGHAFVKIVGAGSRGANGTAPWPRIVVIDPTTVSVAWTPDDWETVVRYDLAWHGMDPDTERPAAFRQVIARSRSGKPAWFITDQRSDGDDPRWRTTHTERWPYGWPPIFACQNLPAPNEYWGMSDLEPDVLGVCRAMSFVLSNAARIIRYHAHPKLWGAGFQYSDITFGPDDLTVLPDRDAALHLLEMQSDLSSSLELYGRVKEALHEIARVPELSAGALKALGRVSGVALRLLYQPLMEKTQTKRTLYGGMLAELSRRVLEMGGFGSEVGVELEWPPVTPTDPLEEARTALAYRQLGLSGAASLRRLGVTEREEEACRDDSI